MKSTLRGVEEGWVGGKAKMLSAVEGCGKGGSKCSGRPIFIFSLKKIGFEP